MDAKREYSKRCITRNVGTQLPERTVSQRKYIQCEDFILFQVPSIFCCIYADVAEGDAVQVCAVFECYRFESKPAPRPSS